jgi:hypothetical protein
MIAHVFPDSPAKSKPYKRQRRSYVAAFITAVIIAAIALPPLAVLLLHSSVQRATDQTTPIKAR